MTHTEHDELRADLNRLADPVEVPEPGFVDASTAWTRGRRWGRRRRAVAGASAALCVVVVGAVAWAVPASLPSVEEAAPASRSDATAQIPGRLWDTPSRAGGIGWGVPAVAAQEAPRWGWFGSDPGVAVRTGDGRQGFVEAPDHAGGVTVSPDGRKIAYWITGETSGTPNTEGGQSMVVTGIAVRDVHDGTLLTHDFGTEHGLSTRTLYFADDALLVADAGAWRAGDDGDDMARGSSEVGGGVVWDLSADAAPKPWEELFGDDVEVPNALFAWARDGRIVTLGSSKLGPGDGYDPVESYDLRTGKVEQVGRAIGEWPGSTSGLPNVVTDRAGDVYLVGDGRREQHPNSVTVVPNGVDDLSAITVGPRAVPGSDGTLGFFGVRDGKVLVSRIDDNEEMVTAGSSQDVIAMWPEGEVRTMEVIVDVQSEGDSEHGNWQWATDLLETAPLADPFAPQGPPESPTSPWAWIAGGAGVLVVALGGAALWWRRAQP
ncbi:hypothetical protein [Nocardioides yefusunii]|uniref:WD40 repeat domain-containing protein n=1 Tax=Nocardioides yefusunii TaxID=2500546 RepID=A0ABW1QXY9_9ACTN|nr:hypothetical protein [Nocardioides yefusunii]